MIEMVRQTEEDFKALLKQQIELLLRSCQSFDDGLRIEAKNMAIRLRVILYDKGRNISLLTHLGKKNILFYDSTHDEGLLTPFMSFIGIKISSSGTEYFPLLDEIPELRSNKKVNFEEWWNKEVLKGPFTREDLILNIAHKDGGAHVDSNLDKKYADLSRNNSMGWEHHGYNGEITTPEGIELVTLRQIAHEVLKSLKDEFPELFDF